ncbi:MAG: TfoX/Sxy family protein [Acidobacteria bacterium]|nr:TfoX/Sxy family protein [Acidobacteriota bacterium]
MSSAVLVTDLRNLGPTSARWLGAAGIFFRADLEEVGAARAFHRVRQAGFRPSLNLLWALQGALFDLDWQDLPRELKDQLRKEVAALEAGG